MGNARDRVTFLHREKLGVNDGALVLKLGTKLGDSWFNESIVGCTAG